MEEDYKKLYKKIFQNTDNFQKIHQETCNLFSELVEYQSVQSLLKKDENYGIFIHFPETIQKAKSQYIQKLDEIYKKLMDKIEEYENCYKRIKDLCVNGLQMYEKDPKIINSKNALILSELIHGFDYIKTKYYQEIEMKKKILLELDIFNSDMNSSYKKFFEYEFIDIDTVSSFIEKSQKK